jgi:hypothetical protein
MTQGNCRTACSGWGSSGERQVGFLRLGKSLTLLRIRGMATSSKRRALRISPLICSMNVPSMLMERLIVDVTLLAKVCEHIVVRVAIVASPHYPDLTHTHSFP